MSSLSPLLLRDGAHHSQLLQALRRLALPFGLLSLGPLSLAVLKLYPALDVLFESATGHFWIVTLAATVAVCLALLILRAAVLRRDGRLLLIGSAFLGISSIFLIHAISTPTVLFTNTRHATTLSTPIALSVGAVLLALSTNEYIAQHSWMSRHWRAWLVGGGMVWAVYGTFMLLYVPAHSELPAVPIVAAAEHHVYDGHQPNASVPEASAPILTTTTAAPAMGAQLLKLFGAAAGPLYGTIVLLNLYTALVYGRRWYRTPTRPLAALTCGAILLAETSTAAYLGGTWQLSFWLYHLLLLTAVVVVTFGLLVSYQRGGTLSSAVSGLLLRSTLERQQVAVRQAMTVLLGALDQGRLHSVPQLRDQLRERFGLADDQLDVLEHAVGAVARERAEQQRLRALAEVGRAVTLNLDPGQLLHDAVTIFGSVTEARLCIVGLVDGSNVVITPEHCYLEGRTVDEPFSLPLASLPTALAGDAGVYVGSVGSAFAAAGVDATEALHLPLRHHNQLLGVLVVQPQSAVPIDERVIALCRSLSSQLAASLANARLYQALQHQHEDLQRSEQARDQLTQMVVHDLKNPLTGIRGFLALLRMTELTPEQHELLGGADSSSSTMLQLVTDLLDIARLEEGRLQLRRVSTDVATLFEGCVAELQSWLAQEQKQVTITVPDSMPPLSVDPGLMRRVITNLLSNAIKHTSKGTAIILAAESDADAVRLSVRDTGQGIAPEQAQRLFERFGASSGESAGQSNTGLGLTFCKLAVEAHGGTIGVESVVGQGTTVVLTFPREIVAGAIDS